MWRRACRSSSELNLRRRISSALRRNLLGDEGDWSYSSEWWGSDKSAGHTAFRSTSDKGNGVVSVLAFHSSRPIKENWETAEKWLGRRWSETSGGEEERFRVVGYQWRSLRFNDETRQSTVKVMAAHRDSEPGSVFLMQQPHCLAVPYLKSMVSAGLGTMVSCGYDLRRAASGEREMRVLCVGHGGGSLPLFVASKIQGAVIDIVEIDPLVISASIQAMGFPAFAAMNSSGDRAFLKPNRIDDILWKGTHERLRLYESDAEKFILKSSNLYDLIFIDAYDGDDIFPRSLWDPDSPFLKSVSNQLHPGHGTVVVNLHSDSDLLNSYGSVPSVLELILPMGKNVSKIGRAYKDVIVGKKKSGFGFTVSVPWICNTTLVVCKANSNRDVISETLLSNSANVDRILNLPFSCLNYIKKGLIFLDYIYCFTKCFANLLLAEMFASAVCGSNI